MVFDGIGKPLDRALETKVSSLIQPLHGSVQSHQALV
jgi:hypothetical protein